MANQQNTEATRCEEIRASHTPGPWKVAESWFGNPATSILAGPHDGLLAHTCVYNGLSRGLEHSPHRAQAEANARLIAAAPDLLEALHGFEREISSRFGRDDDMSPQIRKVVIAARAAVAKAEGRQS